MRHNALGATQRTERRRDTHRLKSRTRRTHAEYCREQPVVRVRRPGVGVGSSGLRILWRRCESELEHRLPWCELLDVAIAESGFAQRFENVEAEIVRRGCE